MISPGETGGGQTRGRDDADNDHDRVPEHLRCVVCLGEGKHPACCSIHGKLVVFFSVNHD
jgi:hypothetical protein